MSQTVHVIFDLDGTITDTEYEVSRITQEIAAAGGFYLPVDEVHRRFSGMPSADKFNKIAGATAAIMPESLLPIWSAEHERRKKALYDQPEVPLVDGVVGVLERLSASGATLSIATSNKVAIAKIGLAKNGLSHYFNERVFGADSVEGRTKPDPAVYIKARRDAGPHRTVVAVEDSTSGIKAAAAAGIRNIVGLLDHRFGDGEIAAAKIEEFRAAGATLVIRSFDNFPETFSPVPKAAVGLKPPAPRSF